MINRHNFDLDNQRYPNADTKILQYIRPYIKNSITDTPFTF